MFLFSHSVSQILISVNLHLAAKQVWGNKKNLIVNLAFSVVKLTENFTIAKKFPIFTVDGKLYRS